MKKIIVLMLALSLIMGVMMAVVSCNEDNNGTNPDETEATTTNFTGLGKDETTTAPSGNEKISYTVTVKDDAGQPIAGVELQICIGDTCLKPSVTDAEGKAIFKVSNPDGETLSLQVNGQNSVAGYTYPTEKVAIDADKTEFELTINKAA